jgi:hypothetical protein
LVLRDGKIVRACFGWTMAEALTAAGSAE